MNLLQPEINSFLKDNTSFILKTEHNFYMKSQLTSDLIAFYKVEDIGKNKLIFFFSISQNQPIMIFIEKDNLEIFSIKNAYLNKQKSEIFDKLKLCLNLEYENYWELVELKPISEEIFEDESFKDKLEKGKFYIDKIQDRFDSIYMLFNLNIFDYINIATNMEEYSYNRIENIFKDSEVIANYTNCLQLREYVRRKNEKQNNMVKINIDSLRVLKNNYCNTPLNFFIVPFSKETPLKEKVVSYLDKQYIEGIYYDSINAYKNKLSIEINIEELDETIDKISFILNENSFKTVINYSVGTKEETFDLNEYDLEENPFDMNVIEVLRLEKISETNWELHETLISCYDEFWFLFDRNPFLSL